MEYKKGFLLMDDPHWITPDILKGIKGNYAVGYNPVDDCDTIEIYDDEAIVFIHLNPERDFATSRVTDYSATPCHAKSNCDIHHDIAERLVRNFKLTFCGDDWCFIPVRLPGSTYTHVYVMFMFSPTDIRDIYITYSSPDGFRVQHLKSFEELYDLDLITSRFGSIDSFRFSFLRSSPDKQDFRRKVTEFLEARFASEMQYWSTAVTDRYFMNIDYYSLARCRNKTVFTFILCKSGGSITQRLPEDVLYCPYRPTLKITKENYKTYFPNIFDADVDGELFLVVQTSSLFGDHVEFIDLRED